MAVLQMQRISICAMKKNRKAILEELQSLGVLEIDAAELDPELKTMDTMNARLIFEKNASLCDQAIEILDEFSKEKQSMLASLAGKPLIGRKQEEEAIRDQEEILRTAREIQGYRKKLTENSAAAVKLEQQEAALAPWLKLDIPMNFGGTAKAAVLVGSIDGNITLDQVYSQLAADAPQLEAFDIREISNDAGKLSLVVVCLKSTGTGDWKKRSGCRDSQDRHSWYQRFRHRSWRTLRMKWYASRKSPNRSGNRYALFTTGRALFSFCPIISESVHRNMRY